MKRESAYQRYISNFAGEFTVGAVRRPIDEVSRLLEEDNQPIETAGPTADEGGGYEVYPCVILTQAKSSDWTLILYCLGDYVVRAPYHLERLSKDLSADSILHAYEDTSGVQDIAHYSAGRQVATYRGSDVQELVSEYDKEFQEHAASVEVEAVAPSDTVKIVEDYDAVYDELGICPIAAAVDTNKTLRIEPTAVDQLDSAVVYDLATFRWRGLVDVKGDWAEQIDLETFQLSRILFGFAPVGSLVLIKSRETVEDREIIQTAYHFATDDGLEPMDKRAASELLAQRAIAQMRQAKKMTVKTEVKKSYKNGNVDLLYKPTRYDQFILKLNKKNVGEDVQGFLDSLSAARYAIRFGSVEPAKSGRATCRTCNQKIEKGELRIGEYLGEYYEYPPSQWHHARCVEFADMTRLHHFDQLSAEQQEELAKLLSSE